MMTAKYQTSFGTLTLEAYTDEERFDKALIIRALVEALENIQFYCYRDINKDGND